MTSCAPPAVVYACGPSAIGALAGLAAAAEDRGYAVRGAVSDSVAPYGQLASRPGWARVGGIAGGAAPVLVVASRRDLGPCPPVVRVVELTPAPDTRRCTMAEAGAGAEVVWCSVFPGELSQLGSARRLVRAFLRPRTVAGCAWDADEVGLAVHELVANATRHGSVSGTGDPVVLTLRWARWFLEAAVEDRSPVLPCARPAQAGACSGRGLGIVDSVAHSWGSRTNHTGPGKTVWMRVEHDRAPRPRFFTSAA
ncbi:ATP-binding protein [Streptomyces yaizuensis]|uniref:ATP-binding protein n=1 Tax=Streptomyces yaizuensis TaxID=2989713 RepID=A0ABQ5P6F0_9ACTN|nr:ATP-binding protein [Streptomyces sp. YSPA8]GLF98137.1 ATP-binding protein [Streptomyces sp. YSPA8]